MSLAYVDLSVDGTPQYLVLNNGVPYGIQNAQGIVLFGGGGAAGPTIKAANGVSLVAGDLVEVNAATSGTPGSGSYVLGIPALDASGNLVGNWIPRTGTLASLQALALTIGEIASATDIPGLVQGTGTAGVNFTYFPFNSTLVTAVGGTGAVSTTLSCAADIVRLTVGAGITSLTASLQNGYIDGQELTIELVSSPSGMNTYTVNGQVLASSTLRVPSANRTPATALIAKFKWLLGSSAWLLCEPGVYTQKAATDDPTGLSWGPGATAKKGGAALGVNANAGVDASAGQNANAVGDNSRADQNGIASGANSFAGPDGAAYADNATAFQNGAQVFGYNGVCFGQANVYGPNAGALIPSGNTPAVYGFASVSIGGGATGNQNQPTTPFSYTSVNNSGFPNVVFIGPSGWTGSGLTALEVDVYVTVPLGVYNGQLLYAYGQVTAVTATTCTVAVINSNNVNPAPTGCPATGTIYACSDGIFSNAFGTGAATHNNGEFAFSPTYFATQGDAQAAIVKLGAQTTDATPTILTTNFVAVNTRKTPGNSNRLILQPGESRGGTLVITLKQNGSANSTTFNYALLATNNGGTISVASSLVKAIGIGTAQWATTWVATPPFSIAGNNTYQSVDITFTGLAGTAINASATFIADSTTTAA